MRAFLIVDIQNDFLPGGALAVSEGDVIVPVINALSKRFDHVLLTQDWHPAGHASFASSYEGKQPFDTIQLAYGEQILWPDHCVQGTAGAAFSNGLRVDRAELIIRKGYHRNIDSYSAFYENDHKTPTGLTGYLKNRGFDMIYIAGLATDFCVHWSAVDGCRQGFEVFVVEDASKGINTGGSMEYAMQQMTNYGVKLVNAAQVEAE